MLMAMVALALPCYFCDLCQKIDRDDHKLPIKRFMVNADLTGCMADILSGCRADTTRFCGVILNLTSSQNKILVVDLPAVKDFWFVLFVAVVFICILPL